MNQRRKRPSREQIQFARDQRARANEFANAIWQLLRNRSCRRKKFRREYPIPPYTADFCCVEMKLIVEADGEHHFTEDGQRRDRQRDTFLRDAGYEILRLPGYDILRDPVACRKRIEQAIDQRSKPPHPQPLSPNGQCEHNSQGPSGERGAIFKVLA